MIAPMMSPVVRISNDRTELLDRENDPGRERRIERCSDAGRRARQQEARLPVRCEATQCRDDRSADLDCRPSRPVDAPNSRPRVSRRHFAESPLVATPACPAGRAAT